MKNYDEAQCVRAINKKRDARVSGKLIEVSKDNGDVGKGTWAKIDYLCHYCGYRQMFVSFVATKKTRKQRFEDFEEDNRSKIKSNKINLHSVVKEIMTR